MPKVSDLRPDLAGGNILSFLRDNPQRRPVDHTWGSKVHAAHRPIAAAFLRMVGSFRLDKAAAEWKK